MNAGSIEQGINSQHALIIKNFLSLLLKFPIFPLKNQSFSWVYDQVGTSYAEETPKFANIDLSGKPYQPPYAHNSSIEEPCTRNSEYSKAPPAVSDLASAEPTKAHANDAKTVRVYNSRDASAKTQLKEQPRGLRRLWKCGKKNQSLIASDKILESDSKSVNGLKQDDHATSTTSSSEGNVNLTTSHMSMNLDM